MILGIILLEWTIKRFNIGGARMTGDLRKTENLDDGMSRRMDDGD
jgi:hypothetical protein